MLYSLSVLYMFGVDYLGISKFLVPFPAQFRLFVVGILLYMMFDTVRDKNITLWVIGSVGFIVLFGEYEYYFKFSLYPLILGLVVIWLVYFVKHIKISFDFSYSFILHFPVIQLALYFSEKYIEKRFVKIVKKDKKNDTN